MINVFKKMGALVVPLALYGFISTGHIPVVQSKAHIAAPYTAASYRPIQSGPEIELSLMPEEILPPVLDDSRLPKAIQLRLALARICVSEAGFQTITDDCKFIYLALKERSRSHLITLGMMRSYSPGVFNKHRTDERRWIPYLNASFTEPEPWTETVGVPWAARRSDWRAVYDLAAELIRTNPSNPCGVRIDHWGAKRFRIRQHLEEGWTIVQCGNTKNTFWTLPN